MTVDLTAYHRMHWEELVAIVQDAKAELLALDTEIRAERAALNAELFPYQEQKKGVTQTCALASAALKRQAVAQYLTHKKEMPKRFGYIRLAHTPRLVVHDLPKAVMLLHDTSLLDPETGELTALVTYVPVLNTRLLRYAIQQALDADMPTPHGWPGIVTLSAEDDPASWSFGVDMAEEPDED